METKNINYPYVAGGLEAVLKSLADDEVFNTMNSDEKYIYIDEKIKSIYKRERKFRLKTYFSLGGRNY